MWGHFASIKLMRTQDIDRRCRSDGHGCCQRESFQFLKWFETVLRSWATTELPRLCLLSYQASIYFLVQTLDESTL